MVTLFDMITKENIADWFKGLQDDICQGLSELNGDIPFHEDNWQRPEGGGGRTRIIEGPVIEKGGVNFSAVHGETPQKILDALKLEKAAFFATGVSIVLHSVNPHVPIIHMNVRYFEMSDGTYWFGGGIDLTPHYIRDEDAIFFHETLKNACDKYDKGYYPKFKRWADDYFYIQHREETRGIGGIFFDRLNKEKDKDTLFQFVQEIGNTFLKVYLPIADKHKNTPFTDQHKKWQKIRRGRYVEFNLVYDKGTKFGLDTGGRIESILMSLPKDASWEYNFQTLQGSDEDLTLKKLKKGINWVK